MKSLLVEIIDEMSEEIIKLGRDLFDNPELGYKELKTKELLGEFIRDVEMTDFKSYALTGFKATIGDGSPHIALVFDMDALPTEGHEKATNNESAAHSCGHHAQMAVMLGAFKAISKSNILAKSGARVSIIGAPAEEFVDMDYRLELQKQGRISEISGKQNLIKEGAFDDIDVVISTHGNSAPESTYEADIRSNGFIAKKITFKGTSSHAGAFPERGKNALNAAMHALSAVAYLRETFKDEDHIRFHPIIKKGGTAVNTVPHEVEVESYVRASSIEAIIRESEKIDNALKHSALALGCSCEIQNIPGYMPSNYYSPLTEYFKEAVNEIKPNAKHIIGGMTFASDDIGNVSCIKPTIQIGFSGFGGSFHGADFYTKDEQEAYIDTTKIVATIIDKMLKDVNKLEDMLSGFSPVNIDSLI